jgi:branched-chain amino acid transport system permease protein
MMYVSPQLLGWKMSGDVVIMTLLGGSGKLVGPVIGVTLVELLREGLSATTEHWYGLLGVIFILCTIYLPEGVAGLGRKLWRR